MTFIGTKLLNFEDKQSIFNARTKKSTSPCKVVFGLVFPQWREWGRSLKTKGFLASEDEVQREEVALSSDSSTHSSWKHNCVGCRDSSVVKNTHCSLRGPGSTSQYSCGSSQPSGTTILWDSHTPFCPLWPNRHTYMHVVQRHICSPILIHI